MSGLVAATPKADTSRRTEVVVFEGKDGQDIRAIVKHDERGVVRNATVSVPMRWTGPVGSPWEWDFMGSRVITAAGWDRVNKFAGCSVYYPPQQRNDQGDIIGNPYHEYTDSDRTTLNRIRCTGVLIGRNMLGNWVIHNTTITFDLGVYFAQDVFKKWMPSTYGKNKKGHSTSPAQPKTWGRMYASKDQARRMEVTKDGLPKNVHTLWMPDGMVLAMDLSDVAALKAIQEHLNRLKFAERLVQSFVKRNLSKHFNGFSELESDYVRVTTWPKVDLHQADMARLANLALDGGTFIDQAGTEYETVDQGAVAIAASDEDTKLVTSEVASIEAETTATRKQPDGNVEQVERPDLIDSEAAANDDFFRGQ